ncbi:hypothetical protein HFN89_00895 [Rhizobium laguerreae]|nr:hypothetical protein [Rhizobium laguerreae]
MSGILLVFFVVAPYLPIAASSRGYRKRAGRNAAYFHSSGFSRNRSYPGPSFLKEVWLWNR